MSILSDLFDPGAGYQAAQNQTQQYYNQGVGALQPYATAGNNALPQLTGAASSLLNPAALQAQWMQSYTTSPEAQMAEAMATQHGLNAASSMGLLGSTPAESAIQAGTSQIGLEDQQNYLHDLMQKYVAGINATSGIYKTGAGAAEDIGNLNEKFGRMAAQEAYGKKAAGGSFLGTLIGAGAGAFFGGPTGAAAGAKIGHSL